MPGPKYVSDFDFPADAGFTGSAGVQHVRGYQRGGSVKKSAREKKISKVMTEFNDGELHSGSKDGPTVANPKQATAIALSEAGVPKKAKGALSSKRSYRGHSKEPLIK